MFGYRDFLQFPYNFLDAYSRVLLKNTACYPLLLGPTLVLVFTMAETLKTKQKANPSLSSKQG